MNKIYIGYLIMKIRMKISYHACLNNNTIQEHILKAIIKTYEERI